MSSCVKDITKRLVQEKIEDEYITIVARHSEDETKTVLSEGGSVLWLPHDSISVFYGSDYMNSRNLKCVANNTSPASVTTFVGKVPAKEFYTEEQAGEGYYYAIYPYRPESYFSGGFIYYSFPSIQYAKKGTFNADLFPSVARSKDLEMSFYNVCGGIKLSVTKEGVRKINIKSNAGEIISGGGNIWIEENNRPRSSLWESNQTSIDLIAPEGGFEVGQPYYIIIPPVTFSEGFTMTFMTDTETAVRNVDKTVEIRRSVFSKMTNADQDVMYEKQSTLVEMLAGTDGEKYWFWDTTSDYEGHPWGAGGNYGNGYLADNGFVPDKWWGWSLRDLYSDSNLFEYMKIDSDLNCISYYENGNEIRRGKITVDGFSRVNRADGWSLGKFSTDSAAILHPNIHGGPEIKEFDILYVSDDQMILAKNSESTKNGSGGEYFWWRFRSVDKNTFMKGKPTSISFDKTYVDVYQGDDIRINAKIYPEELSYWGIEWITEGNLSYYSEPGHYYASESGTSKVKVRTAGGLTAECEVIVRPRIPVEEFRLDRYHVEMIEEDTVRIYATVLPENATLRNVTWESQDTNIATVDSTGLITAVSPGWTNIIAYSDGGRRSEWCQIYVRSNSVEGINLDQYHIDMYPGDKSTIYAEIYPETAKNKRILWESYNTDIATIDESGTVTAVAPGWTQIRAVTEENGYEAYCSINVMPVAVTGITLDKEEVEMFMGDKLQLTASVMPENATNKNVVWTTDKSNIVTVERSGLVRAVGSGRVTVTARTAEGNYTATCTITVRSNGVDPGIGDWGDGDNNSGDAE